MLIHTLLRRWLRRLSDFIGVEIRVSPPSMPVEFSDDDRALVRRVQDERLSMGSDLRLYATLLACKHVVASGIPGDFVECGVWRGGQAMLAQGLFKRAEATRKVYLYDTFGGMTAPSFEDVAYTGAAARDLFPSKQRGDHNAWCFASLDEVQGHFRAAGLLDENVVFVKGDVAETLRDIRALPKQIAVLRLDTDWYESTKLELEILYPRLATGGVLIIDDYGHWGGCQKAVDEYFKHRNDRPMLQYVDYTGRLAIKRS